MTSPFTEFGRAPDEYELYLYEPDKPEDVLRAVLEGEGFEEKEGWWTKPVGRDGMKAAVLSLDRALKDRT
jgi:hypothetical protein